ncbi:hypothetical protein CYMTET_16921, partial [Cymbomonas tetramitiformis]
MGRPTKYPGESEEEKRARQRLAIKKRVQKSRERQRELKQQLNSPEDGSSPPGLTPQRRTGRAWTVEESNALRCGVARYGLGKWQQILRDAEFGPILQSRSNVDLKDKWRCLIGRTPQTSRASSALVALAAGKTDADPEGEDMEAALRASGLTLPSIPGGVGLPLEQCITHAITTKGAPAPCLRLAKCPCSVPAAGEVPL